MALLHGSTNGSQHPQPHLNSCDADGDRAFQFQHSVRDANGDANLGRPTPNPDRGFRTRTGRASTHGVVA
jgi:hypothetical protein